jgi:Fanconi anemia group J protein
VAYEHEGVNGNESSAAATAGEGEDKDKDKAAELPSSTLFVLKSLLQVFKLMLADGAKHADDFKAVIERPRKTGGHNNNSGSNWDSSSGGYVFNMWCFNAAVVFRDLDSKARSILLASGTLSPLDSFAGELGAAFPVRVEAPHVINPQKQVFRLPPLFSLSLSSSSSFYLYVCLLLCNPPN